MVGLAIIYEGYIGNHRHDYEAMVPALILLFDEAEFISRALIAATGANWI